MAASGSALSDSRDLDYRTHAHRHRPRRHEDRRDRDRGRGRERLRRRIAAPRGDYAKTLAAIVGLVHDIERELGARGTVGVGIPGHDFAGDRLVKNANSTWLIGQPLADDLPRLLDRPVRFANDANCFALSEATDGAAAGAGVVFGVIVGTGTGGGVVVDGRVLTGANAIAGEWGHNPLPAPRDDESPGPAVLLRPARLHRDVSVGPGAGARLRASGGGAPVTARGVAARAAAGEARALARRSARYEERMARALASVINVLDPDVIVLGGGLSNIDRLYERVPQLWAPHVFSDRVATRLVRARARRFERRPRRGVAVGHGRRLGEKLCPRVRPEIRTLRSLPGEPARALAVLRCARRDHRGRRAGERLARAGSRRGRAARPASRGSLVACSSRAASQERRGPRHVRLQRADRRAAGAVEIEARRRARPA